MATRALIALLVLGIFAGCAQDIGTIDRVQANYVKKSDLLWDQAGHPKQWYYRQTVIDAPYAAAYTFVGDQSKMERGVFRIQENYLYFYRMYTFKKNEDVNGIRHDVNAPMLNKDGTPYMVDGKQVWLDKKAPVAAFPISSHFDIIWDYNPNTGEKTNVRVENTTDRLWYERAYMRVDWGSNDVTSLQTPMGYFLKGQTAITIYPGDEASMQDRPRITSKYMDFVSEYVMQEPSENLPGYGEIPLCWFYPWYTGQLMECVSEQIKVRSAFLAVDTAKAANYQTLNYTDKDMARFGYFRTERLGFDPHYGTTYSGAVRLINRFNVWNKWVYDKNGNPDYSKMTPKPIVFYLSEDFPNDLVTQAKTIGTQWSKPLASVVKDLTGKTPQDFGIKQMFVICENNTVEAAKRTGDKAEMASPCDVTEEPKRNGDIRYNYLFAVNAPTENGLYGFGPGSSDPMTGETINADAYIYVAAMRQGAQRALDQIELNAGIKYFKEIADAQYIRQDVKYKQLQDIYWKRGYTDKDTKALSDYLNKAQKRSGLTEMGPPKGPANFAQSRASIIRQAPNVEKLLIGDELRILAKDPRLSHDMGPHWYSDDLVRYDVSKWVGITPFHEKLKQWKEMAKKGLDLIQFLDHATIGLALEMAQQYDKDFCDQAKAKGGLAYDFSKFGQTGAACDYPGQVNDAGWECQDSGNGVMKYVNRCTIHKLMEQLRRQMWDANNDNPYVYGLVYKPPLWVSTYKPILTRTQEASVSILKTLRKKYAEEIYQRIFEGVAIHEVGHTLGLRHNFEASSDALNYDPKYWALKVDPSTLEPRNRFKPENWYQSVNKMREYEYSSVMDYLPTFNMPWHGIGLYDKAAIKYGYAQVVEVFQKNPDLSKYKDYLTVDPSSIDPGNTVDLKERGEGLGLALRRIHYDNIPKLFGGTKQFEQRVDVPVSEMMGDAASCEGKIEGTSCGSGKVCKRFYEGLRCSPTDKTMVPYRFCSDEYAYESYGPPMCNFWDAGPDSYDIVQDSTQMLEQYWILRGYWHENPNYWPTYYDSYVRMLMLQMRQQYVWWALNYSVYNHNDYWKNRFGKRWEDDINGGKDGMIASIDSFNYMAGEFGRPIVGWHGYNKITKRYEPYDQINRNNYVKQIYLKEEDGARPIYPDFDYSGYMPNVISSGAIYDRLAALDMLTDPTVDFFATNESEQSQRYLISYQNFFKKPLLKLLGGLVANDSKDYGWCILEDPNGSPDGFYRPTFVGVDPGCHDVCVKFSRHYDQQIVDTQVPRVVNGTAGCAQGYALSHSSPLEPEPLYVFPTTRYRIPLQVAYRGMSWLVSDYDRTFMDMTRIWLKGSEYAPALAGGAQVAQCTDPFSGKTYVAYKMADWPSAPAYDMVKKCQWIFSCFDPTSTLSAADEQKCADRYGADKSKRTLEQLKKTYLFHDVQFVVGKIELLMSMSEIYDFDHPAPSVY